MRRKLLCVVLLIAVLAVPLLGIGLALSRQLSDSRSASEEASEKVDELEALQSSIAAAITSARTYVFNGLDDPRYVESYRAATAGIPDQLDAIAADLPADEAEVADDLRYDVGLLVSDLDKLVGFDAADVTSGSGFQLMYTTLIASLGTTSSTYELVEDAEDFFDQRVSDQRARSDDIQQQVVWVMVASMVVALLAAAVGISVVTGAAVRRIERLSENGDRFLRNEPLLPSFESYDELGQLASKMHYSGELLQQRRNQAEDATRAKDEFLSRVSQGLAVPLGNMIEAARTIDADPALSPESRDDVDHIVTAGEHLQDLIQEMLDIKATRAGQLSLVIEPVPVRAALGDAIALVDTAADARSITITTECDPDAVVSADRRRLRDVLLNVLSNAVKYNHEGGHVEVTAASHDGAVHVAVTDTGPGITPEDQQHLFKPFERLKAADTSIEGSGIGLSLTKHIVEAMGGTIGVDSTPGEGSTFWFDLPTPAGSGESPPGHVTRTEP